MRSTASFSMSMSGTMLHRRCTSFLIRGRLRGSGWGEPDRPGLSLGNVQPAQARHRVVQERQLGGHLLAQLVDEDGGVQQLAQLAVVLLAPLGEVLGQVLVGVSPLVGADDPDLHLSWSCRAWKATTS